MRVDEDVEGQAELPQHSQAVDHVPPGQKVVGLGLGNVPHPSESVELGEVFQPFSQLGTQEVSYLPVNISSGADA